MTAISRLIYVTLYVSDLASSRKFYEEALGYRPVEAGRASVTYAAGRVLLHLDRAADYGVALPGGKDRSIALTFLTDDLEAMRAGLEDRGVRVTPTLTSRAGAMADLYDPDGHWISLYEPSPTALEWPSGQKIRTMRASAATSAADDRTMNGQDLLYLFLFVEDLDKTWAFYREALHLEPIEVTSCHRGVTDVPKGVVKYDVGGSMLTTHHVGDGDHASLHKVTTTASGALALGFHTLDLRAAAAALRHRGIDVREEAVASGVGRTATFRDLGGHVYFLCEPSPWPAMRPGALEIARILTPTP